MSNGTVGFLTRITIRVDLLLNFWSNIGYVRMKCWSSVGKQLVKHPLKYLLCSGCLAALGADALPAFLFTRPDCWHLWERHKKGGFWDFFSILLIFWLTFQNLNIVNRSYNDEKVGNDTVEGIAFSRDTAVIMTGVFVNEEEVASLFHYYTITNTNAAGGWLVSCEQDGALVQALVLSPRQNFSENGRPGLRRQPRQHKFSSSSPSSSSDQLFWKR